MGEAWEILRKLQNGELAAHKKRLQAGPELERFSVKLKVVTPILGGAAVLRQVDGVDVVRVPTIRGHLRFWWRALYGREYDSPEELKDAERKLFGATGKEEGTRSPVRIVVRVENRGNIGRNDVKVKTSGAYVLWPARSEKKSGLPPAPRRLPGTEFTLTIEAPQERMPEVRNALRAWILFGGYGSRTRRGLGSLTVVGDDAGRWLPQEPTREAINALFEGIDDIFAEAEKRDLPQLGGATLLVCELEEDIREDAEACWLEAIGWLEEFRQGVDSGARQSGHGKPQPYRPSISNWPEADKIRHLSRPSRTGRWAHDPTRHDSTPLWPRAGFGLPIQVQFQKRSREPVQAKKMRDKYYWWELDRKHPNYGDEPNNHIIIWGVEGNGNWKTYDRLASPLILKPLPLTRQRFVSCALWLNRHYPASGKVLIEEIEQNKRVLKRQSASSFDRLEDAPGKSFFPPLHNKADLRSAFCDWLEEVHNLKKVAP